MELAVLAGVLVLGPLLFALAVVWRRWTKAWQVLLAAYAGGVCGGEAFRAWYAARSDALMRAPGPHLHAFWIAMPQAGALTLGERLRAYLIPSLAIGAAVFIVRYWLIRSADGPV